MHHPAGGLRLSMNGLDHAILIIYFAVVLGIGFAARRSVRTSLDFFLSGRVPLSATLVLAMFRKRMTAAAGFWGLLGGTVAAMVNYFVLHQHHVISIPSDQGANFVSSIVAFVVDAAISVAVTLVTRPRPEASLRGLVHGTAAPGGTAEVEAGDRVRYRRPALLGWTAVAVAAACYVPFRV